MKQYSKALSIIIISLFAVGLLGGVAALAAKEPTDDVKTFPRTLDSYNDSGLKSIAAILKNRITQEPFNLVATIIFLCAIVHTFLTGKFMAVAHRWEHEHDQKIKENLMDRNSVHHGAELFHFLGEVEAVFGLWAIALMGAIFFSSIGKPQPTISSTTSTSWRLNSSW